MQFNTFAVVVAGTFCGMLLGCGASKAPGSNPQDMSHEEHLAAADQEKETAKEHEDQYDPDAAKVTPAVTVPTGGYLWGTPNAFDGSVDTPPVEVGPTTYNPTSYHEGLAKEHNEHARHHEQAAAELAKFEGKECAYIHPDAKKYCPLLGTLESVEKTKKGALLHVKKNVNTDGILAHSLCHYAFGAYNGRQGMPFCPLYLKDIKIEKRDDKTIEIESDVPAVAEEIFKRARSHVAD